SQFVVKHGVFTIFPSPVAVKLEAPASPRARCESRPAMIRRAVLAVVAAFAIAAPTCRAAPSSAAEGERGMVGSAQHEADAVGVRILAAGGNAVDAAVAVGYALAVVDPCCGNIGGGGFMLIHLADGRDTVIDFRETAPRAASRDMYLDAGGGVRREASLDGY